MTVVMASGLLGDDFDLFTNALVTSADAGEVGILAFHGAPGAPAVDVGALGVGTLVPNLEYQTFQGYLFVPAVVFASGFLGMEPAFGLFAALSDGTVLPLTPDGTVANEDTSFGDLKASYR